VGGLASVSAVAAVAVMVLRPFAAAPETVAVTRRSLTEAVEVSGVAESHRRVVLKARVSGTVSALGVAENQRVARGGDLLRLDEVPARLNLDQAEAAFRASVRQAEAQLASARRTLAEAESRQRVTLTTMENQLAKARTAAGFLTRDLRRLRELAAEGAVSRQALEQQEQQWRQAQLDVRLAGDNLARARTASEVVAARNAVAQAGTALANAFEQGRASLALARQALADTRLVAPFSGAVTDWTVDVGDMVAPGTPLGTFQDLDDLRVKLPVDELDLPRMRPGGPVELVFDAYPERPYAGTIAAVSKASVEAAGGVRVFPVEVRFGNPDHGIRPGMSCDANVIVRQLDGVLAIPAGAMSRDGATHVVRVLNARNQPETVAITPGLVTVGEVEVKAGLREGDRVIYGVARPK
jgi:HlyD family secretion protein